MSSASTVGIEKVYFKAPTRFIEANKKVYEDIVKVLKASNFEVVTENDLYEKFGEKDPELFYKESLKEIKEADALVAEVTISSSTTGYGVAYALSFNKPVLILKMADSKYGPGVPLIANPSKLVTLVEYNEKNLKSKVDQFLKKAGKGIFVKRLPIEFTQNQVEYVEYSQRVDGKKKSFNATVREIINDARDADPAFKA